MDVRTPFYQVRMGDRNIATAGGEDITPWVSAVTVVEDDRQADNVSLSVPDPRMIYADALFEGSYVEVDLGYGEAGQHALMIRALITKVELNYPQDGVPSLTLKGEDRSILMGLVERRRVWRDRRVTDVVREVGEANGFGRVVAERDPDDPVGSIRQDGKTDLAFLQELARTYHSKCFVELDEEATEVLYFIPERRVLTARRADRMRLGYRVGPRGNLISFSPGFDSSYIDRLREVHDVDRQGRQIQSQEPEPSEVVVWELDPVRMAQANARDAPKIRRLYESGAAGKRELQAQLQARRAAVGEVANDEAELESTNDTLESRRLGMTARGSTFGNIWVRAKSIATIVGANERFNGEWYVSNVTHKIDGGGYKTDFKCVR